MNIKFIDYDSSLSKTDFYRSVFLNCKYMREMALIPSDKKTKVGAVILGIDESNDDKKLFGGCNIKISESHVYHAEIIALLKCLSENYKPLEVFVTSRNLEENIHCCLDCRGRLLECNSDISLTVFNPDGTIKHSDKMILDSLFIMEDKSGKIDWNDLWKKKVMSTIGV